MTQFTDAPIFDADQHMYETPDALTKYLPKEFQSKVQFVQIGIEDRCFGELRHRGASRYSTFGLGYELRRT
ncbi:hypothetical protein MAHJHV55_53770 [Mycobacterium avium subsp. hominissuis]